MKKLLLIIGLLWATGTAGYWYWSELRSQRVDFRTVSIRRGDLLATINATGTLEPEEVVDVGSQVNGVITSIQVDWGKQVEANQLLAQVDPTHYHVASERAKAQCELQRASLLLAKANLKKVDADVARNAELVKQHATAQADYDRLLAAEEVDKAAVAVAEAGVKAAEADVKAAELNLGNTRILSPIKGIVIDRRANVGQTVVSATSASSLFLIAKDLSRMQVWASVNEADIGRIRAGQSVRFTVDAFPNKGFAGEVAQVRLNATMTQGAVCYTVVVSVENRDGKLLPYMTANVQFEVGRRKDALLVPNSALGWRPSWTTNYTADRTDQSGQKHGLVWIRDGDTVRPVAVQIGETDGSKTEILGGDLREGTEVVTGEVLTTSDAGRPRAERQGQAGQLAMSALAALTPPATRRAIERTVASMGVNQLLVLPGSSSTGVATLGAGRASNLTPDDADAIARKCPAVVGATPIVRGRAQIVYEKQNWTTNAIYGTSTSYFAVRGWDLSEGAAFSDADVRNASSVCVIGETLKRELFRGDSPLGKELRIQNVAFRVVGVLAGKGANMMGLDQDDIVVAPWTTIYYRLKVPQAASSATVEQRRPERPTATA